MSALGATPLWLAALLSHLSTLKATTALPDVCSPFPLASKENSRRIALYRACIQGLHLNTSVQSRRHRGQLTFLISRNPGTGSSPVRSWVPVLSVFGKLQQEEL